MKKLHIFSFIVSLLLISCSPDSDSNSGSIKAEAEFNGQNWSSKTASYEKLDDGIEITMAGNAVVLLVKLNELKEAEFDLSEDGNQVIFIADEQSVLITDGLIEINSISGNAISGTFEFEYEAKAEGEYGIEAHYGHFYELFPLNNNLSEKKIIEKTKFMFVDGKAGKIDIQETGCSISYNSEQFNLEVDGFDDKNLRLKIQKIDKNTTGIILHIHDNTVKTISVDEMNDEQVTIMFVNGTSMLLL